MIKVVNRIIVLGLLAASISLMGMAKELQKTVTFEEPLKVRHIG
jgi:hypothetical protein